MKNEEKAECAKLALMATVIMNTATEIEEFVQGIKEQATNTIAVIYHAVGSEAEVAPLKEKDIKDLLQKLRKGVAEIAENQPGIICAEYPEVKERFK